MKYILLLLLGLGLMLVSCVKFLEETPTGTLTSESTITSAPGGLALALGPYRSLNNWFSRTEGASVGAFLAQGFEYATGKAYSQNTTESYLFAYEKNSISGSRGYVQDNWNNLYQGVRDCNLSISMLPNTGLSADQKSQYLGEVRTLRAFYYFWLVRYFGDVIYNTSVLTDVTQASRPRTSLKTIYDKIIVPDLEFAINESNLADVKSSGGRVTKLIARTILADVYLTMAGYPYQEVNADPDTTKPWCSEGLWTMTDYPVNTASAKELLQKANTLLNFLYGKFTLPNTYDDFHNPAMNNKGEAIFQSQYLIGTKTNDLLPYPLPMATKISVFGNEWGTYVPSQEYHDSYNPADKRVQDRQFYFYSDTKAKKWDANEGPADKFPVAFLYKWYDYDAVKNTGTSGLNWTLYRYADVLLMLTEVNWALNQLGVAVPETDIIKGINEVRTRALLPTYSGIDVTLQNIMAERAYELIFENKMLWDMLRTRKVLIEGSGQFNGIENYVGHQPVHFTYKFTVRHLLAPIATGEINNNKSCLQNYDWAPKQVGQNN